MDQCQVDSIDRWQGLTVDLTAADDEHFVVAVGCLDRPPQIGDDLGSVGLIGRIARDHQRRAAGQWASDRFPCLAAHNDVVPHRQLSETAQIGV